MKAVKINKTGGPEVIELKDITLDKPGPNEVTIEQKAIGLNYIDTYHRSGLYPLILKLQGRHFLKLLLLSFYKRIIMIILNSLQDFSFGIQFKWPTSCNHFFNWLSRAQ